MVGRVVGSLGQPLRWRNSFAHSPFSKPCSTTAVSIWSIAVYLGWYWEKNDFEYATGSQSTWEK